MMKIPHPIIGSSLLSLIILIKPAIGDFHNHYNSMIKLEFLCFVLLSFILLVFLLSHVYYNYRFGNKFKKYIINTLIYCVLLAVMVFSLTTQEIPTILGMLALIIAPMPFIAILVIINYFIKK